MVVYKLYYYNFMGRAECIRLIFTQASVPFEDIRLSPEEWEKMKDGTAFHAWFVGPKVTSIPSLANIENSCNHVLLVVSYL